MAGAAAAYWNHQATGNSGNIYLFMCIFINLLIQSICVANSDAASANHPHIGHQQVPCDLHHASGTFKSFSLLL